MDTAGLIAYILGTFFLIYPFNLVYGGTFIPYSINYILMDYNPNFTSSILLEIKGERNAHLGLSNRTDFNSASKMYELVIDKYRSLLLNRYGGNILKKIQIGEALLNNAEFKKFWVSWKNKSIEVGRGWDVGVDRILNYTDKETYIVRYTGVRAGRSNGGTITFRTPQATITDYQNDCIIATPVTYPEANKFLLDGLLSNCMKITPLNRSPRSVTLAIHEIGTRITFAGLRSCEEPGLTVYSPICQEQLTFHEHFSNGSINYCTFNLSSEKRCNSLITLNIQMLDQTMWELCGVKMLTVT